MEKRLGSLGLALVVTPSLPAGGGSGGGDAERASDGAPWRVAHAEVDPFGRPQPSGQ